MPASNFLPSHEQSVQLTYPFNSSRYTLEWPTVCARYYGEAVMHQDWGVGVEGAEALGRALSQSKSVTQLCLGNNPLGDEGRSHWDPKESWAFWGLESAVSKSGLHPYLSHLRLAFGFAVNADVCASAPSLDVLPIISPSLLKGHHGSSACQKN
eukprot:1142893-Pelagomonas_calceolata.AAC.1